MSQRSSFTIFVAGLLILPVVGCAPPAVQEVAETAAVIEEIPVTSGSETAVALFNEGQYLLDVGRGVKARSKFQAAVTEDGFAYLL